MAATLSVALLVGCASKPPPEPIELDLPAAVRIASLADACPIERVDRVCLALRAAEGGLHDPRLVAEAREATRSAWAEGSLSIEDAALHWWLRERGMGLLAWNALEQGPPPGGDGYASAATALLDRHFPAYPSGSFRTALAPLPPGTGCGSERAALLAFPGVVRVPTGDEFGSAFERLEAELPCVTSYRVETGTFLTPEANARTGCETLEQIGRELPGAPVHVVGYSQGVRNALETFVACPEASRQVRTLFAMNSAAHGSAAADAVALLLPLPGLEVARCVGTAGISRWWCDRFGEPFAAGLSAVAGTAGLALGASAGEADGAVTGLRSLSTYTSREFWRTKASELPAEVLFFSFSSIITDEARNLPASNRLFYRSVFLAGGRQPWNDMQVRLVDQRLAGPLSGREVVWPVAEGNHFQWELEPHQMPAIAMPAEMFEGIPRVELLLAHVQALAEIGLLVPSTDGSP